MIDSPCLRRIDAVLDQPRSSPDLGAYRDAVAAAAPRRTFCAVHEGDEAARLAREVPPLELARWDASPYAIDRNYWINSIAVRRELDSLAPALANCAGFLRFLRRLHVIYLLGPRLDTPYVPGSRSGRNILSDLTMGPGSLRRRPVRCAVKSRADMEYYRRLARSLPGSAEISENFPIEYPTGLLWGECHWTWTEFNGGVDWRHHFTPPPSVRPAHIRRLRGVLADALGAVERGDAPRAVGGVARFVQLFTCLHPFDSGNYGLAMNIANWLLRASVNGYVPHLHLDWCAHRLDPARFENFFRLMVDEFLVVDAGPAPTADVVARIAALRGELYPAEAALPA